VHRDAVLVAKFPDGGLISYMREDDTVMHTLNTPDGLARKLRQLGIAHPPGGPEIQRFLDVRSQSGIEVVPQDRADRASGAFGGAHVPAHKDEGTGDLGISDHLSVPLS
jgi:hypothetical protein